MNFSGYGSVGGGGNLRGNSGGAGGGGYRSGPPQNNRGGGGGGRFNDNRGGSQPYAPGGTRFDSRFDNDRDRYGFNS